MFRGKESSNRIELSRLVQNLLNFGILGSLRLWGGGRWVVGGLGRWGVSPHMCTCTHMHAHACMHACTHTHKKLQMATNMFIMIVLSSPSSPSSPCLPRHPHVFPIFPMLSLSSTHHPCHPHIIPKPPFNPHPPPPHPGGDHPNQ